MHHPTDRIAHTMAFVTPVVEHWLEREIGQCVHHKGLIRANALTTELHLAPATERKTTPIPWSSNDRMDLKQVTLLVF